MTIRTDFEWFERIQKLMHVYDNKACIFAEEAIEVVHEIQAEALNEAKSEIIIAAQKMRDRGETMRASALEWAVDIIQRLRDGDKP